MDQAKSLKRLIQTIKNRLAFIKGKKSANNLFHVNHAAKIIFHQLQICKQKTTKTSPFEAHFGRKPNTPLSVISIKPKLSNLSYEKITNHYLDENTVTSEDILPDDKWLKGYRSNIEFEMGMTRTTRDANERERQSKEVESRFLRSETCRPIPLTEKAVQVKLARKIYGKRRTKKNLEGFYEVLAPGSNIEVSPTPSTIKELVRAIVTVRISDITKIWHITGRADTTESL